MYPPIAEYFRDKSVLLVGFGREGQSTFRYIRTYFPEMPLIFDDTTTASYTDEMTAAQLDQLEGWGFVIKRHR